MGWAGLVYQRFLSGNRRFRVGYRRMYIIYQRLPQTYQRFMPLVPLKISTFKTNAHTTFSLPQFLYDLANDHSFPNATSLRHQRHLIAQTNPVIPVSDR